MPETKRTQAERSEATRAQLLAVARELFADPGYDATPIDLVAERAGVTKGALYHHFKNKRELYQATFEMLEQEVCEKVIAAAIAAGEDAMAGLRAGVTAFLEGARDDKAFQRVVLVDGPTVLGWETWKEIDERYGFALTKGSIEGAMASGALREGPVDPLAHLFLAALSEAAIQIARADDTDVAMDEMTATIWSLLDGLRA